MLSERRTLAWRFSLAQRHDFYDDLRRFVAAGQPPFKVVERMQQVLRGRRRLRWKAQLFHRIVQAGAGGRSFAQALAPYVPAEEAALLAAGEATARVIDSLDNLVFLTGERMKVRATLVKNLAPVAFLFLLALAVMVVIVKLTMKEAVKLITPDLLTKMVLAPVFFRMGEGVLKYGWLAALILAVVVAVVVLSINRWKPGRVRRWLDAHAPPWSVYQRLQSAVFLMTTASMMGAGLPFRQAAHDVQRLASPWLRAHLTRVLRAMAAGRPEAEAMVGAKGFLPQDVSDRLVVYALMPDFADVMDKLSRRSLEIMHNRINRLGWSLNVLALVLMAGFLLFAMFSLGEVAVTIDPRSLRGTHQTQ